MTATYNLDIKAGSTFRKTMLWKDGSGNIIPLTGVAARMQIRAAKDDNIVMLELTTENSGIVITAAEGKIEIIITDDVTMALSNGVYDLELIFPTVVNGRNVVDRILEGNVIVSKNVTR